MRSIGYNKISFALTEIIQSNDHSIEHMTRFVSLYSLLRLIDRSSSHKSLFVILKSCNFPINRILEHIHKFMRN